MMRDPPFQTQCPTCYTKYSVDNPDIAPDYGGFHSQYKRIECTKCNCRFRAWGKIYVDGGFIKDIKQE